MLIARKHNMVIIEKKKIGTEDWEEFETFPDSDSALQGLIELINDEEIDEMTFYYRVSVR